MGLKYLFVMVFTLAIYINGIGQKYLKGFVYEKVKEGGQARFEPLPNASLLWKGTKIGTVTDKSGKFKVQKPEEGDLYLVTSYVGYKADTQKIAINQTEINIVLVADNELTEVEVTARREAEYIDKINPIKTEVISSTGLQRLACCNLSESFENSGTVDVSFSDAVTGAKQIHMLGLAGIYSQIMAENIPMVRGLSAPFGLTYVPGSWMESIQISKGTASVINGYESITGQINVEFKKPQKKERIFINLYGSNMGKAEFNANSSQQLSEHLSTMTLIHAENQFLKKDMNMDSFLDIPMGKQFNLYHRWNYEIEGKICNQYGIKILYDDRLGGQNSYRNEDRGTLNSYGVGITNQKYELSAKHGIFLNKPGTSLGFQTVGSYHKLDSYFGLTNYKASQKSFYGNFIYQTILGTSDHKLSAGLTYMFDGYDEALNMSLLDTSFITNESVPGAFMQYTYDHAKVWSLIAGFRADYHSIYGFFYTPRLHFKYNLSENSSVRLSAGKGYRTPHVISENIGLLASSRFWSFSEKLKAEDAFNYGISYTQDIKFADEKKATLSLDAFRTEFVNQVIVDIESDMTKVILTNLHGKSYSNSFQANLELKVIKRLDITIVGRYNDVWQTFNDKIETKPMVAPFKGLLSLSYNTKFDKWTFDVTTQYLGSTILPNTDSLPLQYQMPDKSPHGIMLFSQITRRFKRLDVYIGAENITNFVQKNPIVSPENPFGQHFDSSLIWGPIIGRMFYAGLRFKLE